jgi:hypothetical protein
MAATIIRSNSERSPRIAASHGHVWVLCLSAREQDKGSFQILRQRRGPRPLLPAVIQRQT